MDKFCSATEMMVADEDNNANGKWGCMPSSSDTACWVKTPLLKSLLTPHLTEAELSETEDDVNILEKS